MYVEVVVCVVEGSVGVNKEGWQDIFATFVLVMIFGVW